MAGEGPNLDRRGPRRWLAGGIGCLLTLPVLWVAAHLLASTSPPPPLWTLADLPPVPPGDNGFDRVSALRSPRLEQELVELVSESLDDPADVLDRIEERADALRAAEGVLDVDGRQDPLEVFSAEVFADSTDPAGAGGAPALPLLGAHRLLGARVFALLQTGALLEATRVLAIVLRADLELLSTARGLIVHVVAMMMATEAVAWVGVLLEALSARSTRPGPDGAPAELSSAIPGLDAIVHALAVEPDRIDIRRSVISEHIFMRSTFSAFEASDLGGIQRLAYDRRQTLRMIHADHEQLMVLAADPSARADFSEPLGRPLWWIYNPVGKMAVHMADPSMLAVRFSAFHRDREALLDGVAAAARRTREVRVRLSR